MRAARTSGGSPVAKQRLHTRLTPHQRRQIEAMRTEGSTIDGIARRTGVPRSTVWSALSSAGLLPAGPATQPWAERTARILLDWPEEDTDTEKLAATIGVKWRQAHLLLTVVRAVKRMDPREKT